MALTDIAAEMKTTAEKTGLAQRKLERGLTLTLQFIKLSWTLSLSRKGSPPGAMEEIICRAAFGVSEKATRTEQVKDGYYIVRFTWRGLRQMKLAEINPVEVGES